MSELVQWIEASTVTELGKALKELQVNWAYPSEEDLKSVSKEDAVRVLRHAIVILETEGWIKGTAHNDEGYCALGAIGEANDRVGLPEIVGSRVLVSLDTIVGRPPYGYDSMIHFNDDTPTSYEDVILVFKEAIAELEAQ